MDSALLDRLPPAPPGKTWNISAEVAKYDAADVEVFEAKRRVGKGLRSFCRKRARFTGMRVLGTGPMAGWGETCKGPANPFEVVKCDGNLLTNAGIQRLEDLLIVAGGQGFDAAHSRVGAGNSSTAAAATQTDLQAAAGSGNRQFKLASSGPTRATNTITWVATFASGEGNFAWAEWCIDAGTADGTTVTAVMLNRKVASLGTKVSGAVWTFTVTLTIS